MAKLDAVYYECRGEDADLFVELPDGVDVQSTGDDRHDAIGTIYEESDDSRSQLRAVLVLVVRGKDETEVRRNACLYARLAADELFDGEEGDDDDDGDDDGPDPDGTPPEPRLLPAPVKDVIDTVGRIVGRERAGVRRKR